MKYVCKGFTGFNGGINDGIWFTNKKFSLGDAAPHTVSNVKTIAILPYTKAFNNICCSFNGQLSNANILTRIHVF